MKGIILAGGKGSRLFPLTLGVSKQLLPVYDKPMIYYPLSMLMLANIREILIITTPEDQSQYQRFLGDGSQWGLEFFYATQETPRGLADAFIVGKNFIDSQPVGLILGDNIFYGHGLPELLRRSAKLEQGAIIFAYPVHDPERYGVIEFDSEGHTISLEEKPLQPKSNYAVPGIYFYDHRVVQFAESLTPSSRGEIEITDLNKRYMYLGELHVEPIGRGVAWLDAGMHYSLLQASNFVQAVEERQGMMISCPEEIAFRMGFITQDQLKALAKGFNGNRYGEYLTRLANEGLIN
jgi:glucose-1-phosphate thymidylyltransferase